MGLKIDYLSDHHLDHLPRPLYFIMSQQTSWKHVWVNVFLLFCLAAVCRVASSTTLKSGVCVAAVLSTFRHRKIGVAARQHRLQQDSLVFARSLPRVLSFFIWWTTVG